MKIRTHFILSFLLLMLCTCSNIIAQITGTWQGILKIQTTEIPLVFHISKTDSGYIGSFDSPSQMANNLKFNSVIYDNDSITCLYNTIAMKYTGKPDSTGKIINGIYTQSGFSVPLQLKKTSDDGSVIIYKRPQEPKPPFPYSSEDVSFLNPTSHLKIAGTLTLPSNSKNVPIAVMITGSGQQDRNEEIFGHKPFWVIADYFARNGIGVLRDDDRGVRGTDRGNANATSADFATDVNAAVDYLHSRGYTNIGLIGHSEGGMIAPMVASKRKDVKFIVLLAGPGIPCNKIIYEQTYLSNKAMGINDSVARFNEACVKRITDYVKNYNGNDLKNGLSTYYDSAFKKIPQINSLNNEQYANLKKSLLNQMDSPWMVYFLKYNPATALEQTKCPVLALDGTLDTQVPCEEDLHAIDVALKKGGNKHFETKAMLGLNHLFQHAKTGGLPEYGTIEETISPEVLQIMKDWILKAK
ncbi:MAG: acyl-CoA thioester hydrolase/BAAT C-terminal domain-containing protein [Arachidicoccus sp.]|nr:acyl-CoA thioester hydrolase/BAAT C-terminal domain-containing protein [Arachidicoccus sp.]